MFQSRTIRARTVVMLAVLLAHLALIMLVNFDTRAIRKVDKAHVTYLTFIKEKVERSSVVLKKDNGVKQTQRVTVVPDIKLDTSAASSSASSAPVLIDWDAKASAVAEEAAKKLTATHFKSFNKQDPCSKSDPLNNLKKECQIQTNQIDWDSESAPPRFGFGRHPPANGTLFDHLKPAYLRKPVEDICSKTMVGCNHSSSSSAH